MWPKTVFELCHWSPVPLSWNLSSRRLPPPPLSVARAVQVEERHTHTGTAAAQQRNSSAIRFSPPCRRSLSIHRSRSFSPSFWAQGQGAKLAPRQPPPLRGRLDSFIPPTTSNPSLSSLSLPSPRFVCFLAPSTHPRSVHRLILPDVCSASLLGRGILFCCLIRIILARPLFETELGFQN